MELFFILEFYVLLKRFYLHILFDIFISLELDLHLGVNINIFSLVFYYPLVSFYNGGK